MATPAPTTEANDYIVETTGGNILFRGTQAQCLAYPQNCPSISYAGVSYYPLAQQQEASRSMNCMLDGAYGGPR